MVLVISCTEIAKYTLEEFTFWRYHFHCIAFPLRVQPFSDYLSYICFTMHPQRIQKQDANAQYKSVLQMWRRKYTHNAESYKATMNLLLTQHFGLSRWALDWQSHRATSADQHLPGQIWTSSERRESVFACWWSNLQLLMDLHFQCLKKVRCQEVDLIRSDE